LFGLGEMMQHAAAFDAVELPSGRFELENVGLRIVDIA